MTSEADTLGDWLDAIAARSPAPSGGSTSAVVLACAGGLAEMVARFSTAQLAEADELAAVAESLRRRAFGLAAADEAAWSGVLDAARSARAARAARAAGAAGAVGAAEVPASGSHAVRAGSAFVVATEVPLRMVEVAAELFPVLRRLAESGNQRLLGDALAGQHLCFGAASSAGSLVRLNLAQLPAHDRARIEVRLASAERLLAEASGGRWFAPGEPGN